MMTRTRAGLCRLEAKPAMKKAKAASTGASNSKLQHKKHSNKNSGPPMLIDIKPPKDDLVAATVLARPSLRNKSPYVGDVELEEEDGRTAIAHMPSLDMGGKCVPGARILLKPARDSKGNLVGSVSKGKYGTPKCEFIAQLLWVSEPENAPGCWIGAHPSLGERLAHALLSEGHVAELPPIVDIKREVTHPAGCDMRADFVLTHGDKSKTVLEVKTVVDTDYDAELHRVDEQGAEGGSKKKKPKKDGKVVKYLSHEKPYRRAGIFPWGGGNQRGPDGEKVVSARAIKHVRELTQIAQGQKREEGVEKLRAAVMFVVIREDALSFRPNHEACPSFARYLREAQEAGVQIFAQKIRWGRGSEVGKAFWEGALPVTLSE